ncbi:MAG TPA: DUF2442 domain-containing protein [Anaerolineales bacterium]|nr:DUF2442 domain-containing protein [Anaerolineales bacterium]
MTPSLQTAEYAGGYRLRLSFADGKVGEIDLEDELWGEVFELLKDKEVFKQFRIDPELGTIIWPNGADFAPEFLYYQSAA